LCAEVEDDDEDFFDAVDDDEKFGFKSTTFASDSTSSHKSVGWVVRGLQFAVRVNSRLQIADRINGSVTVCGYF